MNSELVQVLHELQTKLEAMGLRRGDILYVASDMTRLLYDAKEKYDVDSLEDFLDVIVNILQESIGEEGTLLFPVFTWKFFSGQRYDIRKTTGETGALGNYVLRHRKDFRRTLHVSHSFMVWGKDADMLVSMDNTHAWLGGSPFDYFYEASAKMLMLHVPAVRCCTFQHYAEERVKTPIRYIKEFRGFYTDTNGLNSERIYPHFVRDLSIKSRQCMPDSFLIERADAKKEKWAGDSLLLVDLRKAVDATEDDLLFNNGENCYEFDNYQMNGLKEATHKPEVFILQMSDRINYLQKFDDDSAYKVALLSDKITPRQIMEHISMPKSVYKYRTMNSRHLEDSLQGKMFFSLPSKINANDPDDCKVNIERDRCVQFLMELYKCNQENAEKFYMCFEKEWIKESTNTEGEKRLGLQDKIKIACFTTLEPNYLESGNMWKDFGDGAGYCIEYEVTEELFYPGTTIFLPVCYELDKAYDDTGYVLKIIEHLKSQMDEGKVPQLDERFVACGYNHTLFKPSKYKNEKEWRIVVTANRDNSYFDENLEYGSYKFMQKAMRRIYTRKNDKGDPSLLDIIREYAEKMNVEYVEL